MKIKYSQSKQEKLYLMNV